MSLDERLGDERHPAHLVSPNDTMGSVAKQHIYARANASARPGCRCRLPPHSGGKPPADISLPWVRSGHPALIKGQPLAPWSPLRRRVCL
jgi:hypothetical protein